MIISLWVPDTLENGTESSAVLDCVYNYTEQVLKYWTITITITINAVLDCIYNYTEQVNISWDWTYSQVVYSTMQNRGGDSHKIVLVGGMWLKYTMIILPIFRTEQAWKWNGIGGVACIQSTNGFHQTHHRFEERIDFIIRRNVWIFYLYGKRTQSITQGISE